MTDGEFPFRSFTMRAEGYDQAEVDGYIDELRGEITELRRAVEAATVSGSAVADTRLHDPEGAVTRTLAIAQETADRVLHDAQVEADRRRAEADEHATSVIADADERAARLLADMEAQAAEVREQGIAAARSAIQVERDKAMAELAQVRRVRDDLRSEAVELKAALDRYRSQAREAADALGAASTGPLTTIELPDFVDDDVVLAGIAARPTAASAGDEQAAPSHLHPVADTDDSDDSDDDAADKAGDADETDGRALAEVIAIDGEPSPSDVEPQPVSVDEADEEDDADPADDAGDELADDEHLGGTFLAEVRAAAEEDDVSLAPENDDSDRFLSELRGIAADTVPADDGEFDDEAAGKFFDET